jgi:hypothetical protein
LAKGKQKMETKTMALQQLAQAFFLAAALGPLGYGAVAALGGDHNHDGVDAAEMFDPDKEEPYDPGYGFDWGSYFDQAAKLAGDGYKWEFGVAKDVAVCTWNGIDSAMFHVNQALNEAGKETSLTTGKPDIALARGAVGNPPAVDNLTPGGQNAPHRTMG